MILLILALLSIASSEDAPHGVTLPHFNTSHNNSKFELNFYNFLQTWDIPPNTETILGGYLPYCDHEDNCGWYNFVYNNKVGPNAKYSYINTQNLNIPNVHGVYFDVREHNSDGVWDQIDRVGLLIAIHGTSHYSLLMVLQDGVEASQPHVAVKICHWNPGNISTYHQFDVNLGDGGQCVFNQRFSLDTVLTANDFYGFQWTDTYVDIYLGGTITKVWVVNDWSVVEASISSHWNALNYGYYIQFVNRTTYYAYNSTGGSNYTHLQLTECHTDYCAGYAKNVFVPIDGKIPEGFSFSNWFLLTDKSTLVQGRVLSSQPVFVQCLRPVPTWSNNTAVVHFKNDVFCPNVTADVLRFNLNFSDTDVYTDSTTDDQLHFTFEDNTTASITCYSSANVTDNQPASGSISHTPFVSNSYLCFANFSHSSVSRQFLGILPPTVREFAFGRDGSIFVNGYKYFSLQPIKSVNFSISSVENYGFWTIAYTNYTDVMVDVNGTVITRLFYCDSPLNRIKCQQLKHELPDGFYSASMLVKKDLPKTFVTMPQFYNWMNVTLHVVLNDIEKKADIILAGAPELASLADIHFEIAQANGSVVNVTSVCVQARQLALFYKYTSLQGLYTYSNLVQLQNYDCPFSPQQFNNYLQFETLCFDVSPAVAGCKWSLVHDVKWRTQFATITVSYKDGAMITTMPKAQLGFQDISNIVKDECTDYNIYGFQGTGIIRSTTSRLVAGLYYTSASGDLLGFKISTTGEIFTVVPCDLTAQAAVINDEIVGAITATNQTDLFEFVNHTWSRSARGSSPSTVNTYTMPQFYYITKWNNGTSSNCTSVITYSSFAICNTGEIKYVNVTHVEIVDDSVGVIKPVSTGNITIPKNFTVAVQAEYVQIQVKPVAVDCAKYVCNGNRHCLNLLTQYTSACQTIENSLNLGARLESLMLNDMITVSDRSLEFATVDKFNTTALGGEKLGGLYFDGLSSLLPPRVGMRSAVEDLLFNKVVTSGLGTVDDDYKKCSAGTDVADLVCAQYYNGIMVLPGVVDYNKMAMYTASLIGGMALGSITSAVAVPFSMQVQARLNYVALQTDVLQENQKILANAFNNAIGNITLALGKVSNAITTVSDGFNSMASALTKIQSVVNQQGEALSHLISQLQKNFQAISSSIAEIYNRLEKVEADAQVDRLITGRLAALNAYVAQTLTQYAEVKASRQLAMEKVNECVKSQSDRYGFCGNGTHLFSLVNSAPDGLLFFHTVLLPTEWEEVTAWSGICVNDTYAYLLKDFDHSIFSYNGTYMVTPRNMFQPRKPQMSDFVQITSCEVTFLNTTHTTFQEIVIDYIDINKTIADMLEQYHSNYTTPELDLQLEIFNQTKLNLTAEIDQLEQRADNLTNIAHELQQYIDNLNKTIVDLEWLNRIETYVKWPWYVWLLIGLVVVFCIPLLLFCCLSTGCCGCFGCLGSCCHSLCSRRQFESYEPIEKVHVH
ncbi:spike protein [Feline coronavirus UU4]|uniref:Spike glycoprotein n=1 Tax=Feline coronavirus UU4 TaxID=454952 RepID=C6GHB7_9ALPC|nr:spike protein [Feline coronavirus UU4]